jgi:hypothetical protein
MESTMMGWGVAVVDVGEIGPQTWNIREGVGLVLPLHGQLIDFQNLGVIKELDLEIAAAYLRVATNAVNKALEGRKIING